MFVNMYVYPEKSVPDIQAKLAAFFNKRVAVSAFRHSRVCFMCADVNCIERAVVFILHIVLALLYCTSDT